MSPGLSAWREIHRVRQPQDIPCIVGGISLLTTRSLVSVFPAGINVGATWDKRLAYERGKAMGVENRAKGITVLLGPVAGGLGRVSLLMKLGLQLAY